MCGLAFCQRQVVAAFEFVLAGETAVRCQDGHLIPLYEGED